MKMVQRVATMARRTAETDIQIRIDLDGNGDAQIKTGIGFLDHMLDLLARHSGCDLAVDATGDLQVDEHHLVEDVGIVLGQVIREALGDKRGIERYGSLLIPMDEVLVAVALDLGGRAVFVSNYVPERSSVGALSTEMVPHFFGSLASELRANLHIRFIDHGANEHHRVEAMFKGFARALRAAVRIDQSRAAEIPSTKGVL
jgi:imidazoleglycerol phosphate dehydratase HisB